MVIICPKCNGTGRVFDHVSGIGTFGIDYLFQMATGKEKCPRCKGQGYLIIKE